MAIFLYVFLYDSFFTPFVFYDKIIARESMKTLVRIFTICMVTAPLYCAFADGPVATTDGHNLTAFNPSNANNNQWATISNGRDSANSNAKADFGNCNAVILRCAQPKCANGGCSDMNVAAGIVLGCVQSNENCKKYGNDLINAMSAQLVANSTAKANSMQLQMAQQQQVAQQQQMAEMQSQMQQQMMQMQQQMAEQNAQTQMQLQNALAQQQEQNQAALANITVAAEAAAKETESGLSSYQEDAISRGISTDILERQKISGQIMTEIENAEVSLKEVKTVMNDVFEYAGCDARGNNCTGPKRIKKFRERAAKFMDPYDNVVDKIYDALTVAQSVGGIDLSDIYMMLDGSCNSWGQYMCPPGTIDYTYTKNGQKGNPVSCPEDNIKKIQEYQNNCKTIKLEGKGVPYTGPDPDCMQMSYDKYKCKPCTLLKVLTDQDSVYQGWVDAENSSTENQTIISCASSALNGSRLFKRKARAKSGLDVVDMDQFDRWITQSEPNSKPKEGSNMPELKAYCSVGDKNTLQAASLSRSLSKIGGVCGYFSGKDWKKDKDDTEDCEYVNPVLAICDTHAYNNGLDKNPTETAEKAELQEVIALKATVISQQLYKQYEYLSATLRRLKIQLEKAVLTANLEAAGATDGSGSVAGGLAGGSSSTDKQNGIYLPNAQNCSLVYDVNVAYSCLQQNITIITQEYKNKNACKQLVETKSTADTILGKTAKDNYTTACKNITGSNAKDAKCTDKDAIKQCAIAINWAINADKEERENKKSGIGALKGLLGG